MMPTAIREQECLQTATPSEQAPFGEILHFISCEYPPDLGGVSDYSYSVVQELSRLGVRVEVWAPGREQSTNSEPNLRVHRGSNRFGIEACQQIGRLLTLNGPRSRVLVQWVPHGYGFKGLNVGVCAWMLWRKLVHGDWFSVMFHEPCLGFEGGWRHNLAALIQRFMAILLLQAAEQVSVTIPHWEKRLRPLAFGKKLNWRWIPVPSNVPVVQDDAAAIRMRARYCAPGETLFGHFGTFHGQIGALIQSTIPELLRRNPNARMLLFGDRSSEFRNQLAAEYPGVAPRLFGAGKLDHRELSLALSACDIMIQPYPDGVSTRRGSTMAALSHGKPTVTTTGWLSESLWGETNAVVAVPVSNASDFSALGAALANAATELAADRERQVAVGKAALSLYQERFDLRHTVQAIREELWNA